MISNVKMPGYIRKGCNVPPGEGSTWPGGPVPRPYSQRVFWGDGNGLLDAVKTVMVLFLSDRILALCGLML